MSNFQKTYIIPLLILISGIGLIFLVDHKIEEAELEKREVRLQTESNIAIAQFLKGINKLAILTSGIRSYIESKPGVPTKEDLQSYLKTQFEHLASKDSLVVSFIDSNHIFRYSVTPNSLTPNNLDGSSVKKIRDSFAIARLDKLLTYPEFRLFPPINMVEGYVGIPLNFRVVKDSVVIGYIASLINFKSIINDLYLNNVKITFTMTAAKRGVAAVWFFHSFVFNFVVISCFVRLISFSYNFRAISVKNSINWSLLGIFANLL